MYTPVQLTLKYGRYYLTALNGHGHGIHSPFLFQFVQQVLNNKNNYIPPPAIEALRKRLRTDGTLIEIEDFGAGSRSGKEKGRAVSDLVRVAVKPRKYSRLLYRLVQHHRPRTIIELGTSLGLTTAYLASANPAAQVITIEGSAAIADLARENFRMLNLNNITAVTGNFDTVLPEVLSLHKTIDLAYIDGNHRLEPALHYFHQLLQKKTEDTVLVFDDIHWSDGMEKAWHLIQQHPAVTCTIDVFFMGFVFFRSGFKIKQHVTIRF